MTTCADCKIILTTENCYVKSDGRFRSHCKECHNKKSNKNNKISSKSPHRRKSNAEFQRLNRKNLNKLPSIILKDSRGSDKKKNLENDLSKEFIEKAIAQGCSYCGETELRMTLDRINNDKGHLKSNVVPACIRCNYARRSMPYEAWLIVAKGMKEAKEKGLFGEWTGRCR